MFSWGIVFISSQHVYLLVKSLGLWGLAVQHLSMIRNTDLIGRIYCVLELLCQIFFLPYSGRFSFWESHWRDKGLNPFCFLHICVSMHTLSLGLLLPCSRSRVKQSLAENVEERGYVPALIEPCGPLHYFLLSFPSFLEKWQLESMSGREVGLISGLWRCRAEEMDC